MRGSGMVLVIGCAAGCGFSVDAHLGDAGAIDHPIDQPPADAFSIASCPAAYILVRSTSRYRVVLPATAAWLAHDACAADLPGATHLAVLDDVPERDLVQSAINAQLPGTNMFWVGGVQRRDATTIAGGWLAITGGTLFASWHASEPTDDDGAPPYDTEVHAEQFVRLDRNGVGLVDAPGKVPGTGYVCECDGKPVDPMAAQAVIDSTGI